MSKNKSFCNKKKLDKIKAMMIISNAQSATNDNPERREKRYYYCRQCKAYHTTSQDF